MIFKEIDNMKDVEDICHYYDPKRNDGLVNVGKSHNTAEFAVESIRQWWNLVGKHHYAECKNLLICADGGGSNGSQKQKLEILFAGFGGRNWNSNNRLSFSARDKQME